MFRKAADFTAHALLTLVAGLIIGFVLFANAAVKSMPPSGAIKADGIVALTGDGRGRVTEGLRQLQLGAGKRLLISGANARATDQEIADAYKVPDEVFKCCVDIGRAAEDTIGNARETADWARKHKFRSLVVVTADFHMARSLAEIRLELPTATLISYPVQTLRPGKKWWGDTRTLNRLSVEYVKYILTNIRSVLAWLNPFDNKA